MSDSTAPVVGVIGGSGLYEMEGFVDVEEVRLETPFGDPSDTYRVGQIDGIKVAFLPRHGRGHRLIPSNINYRANIFGFKLLGVNWLISVSAVGSMREEIVPGHLVFVDQFFDRTKNRVNTFYGDGIVAHVMFADPICETLRGVLLQSAREQEISCHDGGTYICMEGPAFSTRAESHIYRKWGVDVIGMTNIPEAKLAREAEISYATIALATDYDCWHDGHDDVSVEGVLQTLRANVENAKRVIRHAIPRIPVGLCPQHNALENALMTDPAVIPPEKLSALKPLIGKYYS